MFLLDIANIWWHTTWNYRQEAKLDRKKSPMQPSTSIKTLSIIINRQSPNGMLRSAVSCAVQTLIIIMDVQQQQQQQHKVKKEGERGTPRDKANERRRRCRQFALPILYKNTQQDCDMLLLLLLLAVGILYLQFAEHILEWWWFRRRTGCAWRRRRHWHPFPLFPIGCFFLMLSSFLPFSVFSFSILLSTIYFLLTLSLSP